MTRNLPTLNAVAGDPAVLRGLSPDALDAIMSEASAQGVIVGAVKKAVMAHVETHYAKPIAAAYAAQAKDFGTVRISDGGYEIVIDTPKKPDWDQDELAKIHERIKFSGEAPSDYIKVKYEVSETAYGAWPANIRNTFEPARTVKPGPRSVKFLRKEAA